jgi:hypothetical protein
LAKSCRWRNRALKFEPGAAENRARSIKDFYDQ